MPPSTLAAAAAVVTLLFWLLRRRRPVVVLRSTDASAVAALNRSQIEAVLPQATVGSGSATTPEVGVDSSASEPDPWAELSRPSGWAPSLAGFGAPRPSGAGERQRRASLHQLRRHFELGGAARLAAVQAAGSWGDRCVLPLLRQGLRDPDLAVVREAARGLERFRGGGAMVQVAGPRVPLPPNVARTR